MLELGQMGKLLLLPDPVDHALRFLCGRHLGHLGSRKLGNRTCLGCPEVLQTAFLIDGEVQIISDCQFIRPKR